MWRQTIITLNGNLCVGEDLGRKGAISVFTKTYKMLDGTKKELVKQVGDGSIVKRFDKTAPPENPTDVVCPHFLELKWANGCPFNCAWCYLQGTYRFLPNGKKPRVKDREKVGSHLDRFFSFKGPSEMLNSGELADSLMTERFREPFSEFVLEYFEKQNKHKILFLTKSDCIRNLLSVEENGQAVVSFSINAKNVANKWEKAPSVLSRVKAAYKVSEVGYETRLRIDPMVPYGDWKEHYTHIIDEIFNRFEPSRITLGSLRGLQSTINHARDRSWVHYLTERSNWGRKISFSTRYEMYRTVINHLQESHGFKNTALCKESLEMWDKLGMDYRNIKCNCIL